MDYVFLMRALSSFAFTFVLFSNAVRSAPQSTPVRVVGVRGSFTGVRSACRPHAGSAFSALSFRACLTTLVNRAVVPQDNPPPGFLSRLTQSTRFTAGAEKTHAERINMHGCGHFEASVHVPVAKGKCVCEYNGRSKRESGTLRTILRASFRGGSTGASRPPDVNRTAGP